MKRGTFIINPYVNPDYFGKPNPNYKTMYWKKSGQYAICLDYELREVRYFYKDVITWKTDGCLDLSKNHIKNLFGIVDDKWVNNGG